VKHKPGSTIPETSYTQAVLEKKKEKNFPIEKELRNAR
jgi:hypothetical protein